MDNLGQKNFDQARNRLPAVKVERKPDVRVGNSQKSVPGMAKEKREMAFVFGGIDDNPFLAQLFQLFNLFRINGDP